MSLLDAISLGPFAGMITRRNRQPPAAPSESSVYVTARNLTPNELKNSRFPDRALINITARVRFESEYIRKLFDSDRLKLFHFDGFEVSYNPDGPKSLVFVHPLYEPGQSQMRHYKTQMGDYKRFTQTELADILESATSPLSPIPLKVESMIIFGKMPESAAVRSGLPLEKLAFYGDYNRATEWHN